MKSDHDLVRAVLGGERNAFTVLMRRHQKLIWHLILRMVPNHADAEELLQETFFRAHQNLHQFRFESALSTWIAQIGFSLCRRFLEKKRLPLLEASEDGEDALQQVPDPRDLEWTFSDAELVSHVGREMSKLPPLWQTLLTLFHGEDQSLESISAITGLPEGTVKSYLFRARAKLRAALTDAQGVWR
jgi:RNA polymerase sigma factor (sigma-70 family)